MKNVLLYIILGLFTLNCSAKLEKREASSTSTEATIPDGGLLYFASYGKTDQDIAIRNPYIIGALYTIYWSEVEPVKGQYQWDNLDRFIEKWSAGGKKIALRVIWISTGLWPYQIAHRPTPAWLWAEGAKFFYDSKTDTEIPLFWDPIYYDNALRFMRAIKERYGDHPAFLFISATPGYETFPCHPKTESVSPGFFDAFASAKDSKGQCYTPELWQKTVKDWITTIAVMFGGNRTFVSLNRGGLYPEEDYFEVFGRYAVANHSMVGQNGIKASSYQNPSGGRYKLFKEWRSNVPIFQEMALASGNEERQVGSLMGVMEAAVRIDCNYLNVYAIDVLKGTRGYKDFDPLYEEALKFGQQQLQFLNSTKP